MSVTGHAGGLVNDGLPHPDKAVEKCGFTHIRSSYYSYKTHISVSLIDLASRAVSASYVTACRMVLPVLASPQAQFLLLCTDDAPFAHFLVPADLRLRETAVLTEYDIET